MVFVSAGGIFFYEHGSPLPSMGSFSYLYAEEGDLQEHSKISELRVSAGTPSTSLVNC
jgi:hypothetical protein